LSRPRLIKLKKELIAIKNAGICGFVKEWSVRMVEIVCFLLFFVEIIIDIYYKDYYSAG